MEVWTEENQLYSLLSLVPPPKQRSSSLPSSKNAIKQVSGLIKYENNFPKSKD